MKKEQANEQIKEIVNILEDLERDGSVPKNIKDRFNVIVGVLKENVDVKIKVNKALHDFDDISDDVNLQPYTRTQIWNIVSLLEKIS